MDRTIAGCAKTAGTPTPATAGGGWLQLTDVTGSARGGVLYDRPVPASAGIVVTFQQAQFGGNGADGIGFFLTDGASALTSAGGFGGSLGYAQRNAEPGVAGGYVGVGLDAYGNYWNDGEGRGAGCAVRNVTGTLHKDTVSVRGPGSGTTNYCLLASQTVTSGHSLRATTLDAAPRTVRLTVAPQDAAATHGPDVTVQVDWNGDGDFDDTDETVVSGVHAAALAPAMYKFGFTASTGGSNDAHLIRNLVVTTARAARRQADADQAGELHARGADVRRDGDVHLRRDEHELHAREVCRDRRPRARRARHLRRSRVTWRSARDHVHGDAHRHGRRGARPEQQRQQQHHHRHRRLGLASAVGTGMLVPSNRADAPVTVASRPDVQVEPLSGPGGVVVRDAGGAVADLATTTVQAGWSATPVYVVTNTGNTRVDLTVTSGASALTCAATALDPGGVHRVHGPRGPDHRGRHRRRHPDAAARPRWARTSRGRQSPQRSAAAVLPLRRGPGARARRRQLVGGHGRRRGGRPRRGRHVHVHGDEPRQRRPVRRHGRRRRRCGDLHARDAGARCVRHVRARAPGDGGRCARRLGRPAAVAHSTPASGGGDELRSGSGVHAGGRTCRAAGGDRDAAPDRRRRRRQGGRRGGA